MIYLGDHFFNNQGNESLFVMHDLAEWAAGYLCYRLEEKLGCIKQSEISSKVRHFSYIRCWLDDTKKFEDFPKYMHLRTFLPLPIKNKGYLTNYVPSCLLPQLRYLRVLSLGGYAIVEVADSIGDLKHLRYLNLSNAEIRSLPESICSLYNLQTLILKEPYEGVNICKQVFEWGLHRLMSLTFLYIDGGFLDWKSFPSEEDGKMTTLPSSLTKLEIWNFPNIVFLSSKGFENLSALVELASLPKKGLPPLLLQLRIYECPLLKPHCKKGKGREWLKIVNIPLVEIDLAGEAL
jgi:hypothetical protein